MTLSEAATLLALAAAYDQRTIGDADVLAWQQALSDITADQAQAALIQHYRVSDDRITPAKVRAVARPEAMRHPSAQPVPLRALASTVLTGNGARQCRDAMTAAASRNQRQREAVLARPELAQRLVDEGGYPQAAMWNGFVPPEHDADGNRNNSARRQLLAELVSLATTPERNPT